MQIWRSGSLKKYSWARYTTDVVPDGAIFTSALTRMTQKPVNTPETSLSVKNETKYFLCMCVKIVMTTAQWGNWYQSSDVN